MAARRASQCSEPVPGTESSHPAADKSGDDLCEEGEKVPRSARRASPLTWPFSSSACPEGGADTLHVAGAAGAAAAPLRACRSRVAKQLTLSCDLGKKWLCSLKLRLALISLAENGYAGEEPCSWCGWGKELGVQVWWLIAVLLLCATDVLIGFLRRIKGCSSVGIPAEGGRSDLLPVT